MTRFSESSSSVGLVVLNYNNADETVRFLQNISELKSITTIQVVDNASTDGSDYLIEKFCEELNSNKIYFTRALSNKGYGSGNNFGVKRMLEHSLCDYLLIANPDTKFDNGCIQILVEFLDSNKTYAAVAPLMTSPNGTFCQSAWKLPNKIIMIKNIVRLFFPIMKDPSDYGFNYKLLNQPVDVDVLPGSLFLIRRDVFTRIGGFDEDTFLYGEENLLFFKVRDVGCLCALHPDGKYIHAHGTSINKEISSVKNRYLLLLDSNVIYCKKI